MDKLIPLIPQGSFDPEEVHELTVAYQNICAAIDGGKPSPETRENIAKLIVNMAIAGERNSTELYLRCLEQCRLQSSFNVAMQTI
jgi:hypothetical protein